MTIGEEGIGLMPASKSRTILIVSLSIALSIVVIFCIMSSYMASLIEKGFDDKIQAAGEAILKRDNPLEKRIWAEILSFKESSIERTDIDISALAGATVRKICYQNVLTKEEFEAGAHEKLPFFNVDNNGAGNILWIFYNDRAPSQVLIPNNEYGLIFNPQPKAKPECKNSSKIHLWRQESADIDLGTLFLFDF